MRLTSDSGRKLRRYTPRPATLESVEKAITEMPRVRATCATAGTEAANSGPRIISAPSLTACCAPALAPCELPASSLTRSWMFGFWNSASAISAAFFIDCAATPALPAADSGRIRPTLTCPEPTAVGSCCGPAGASEPPKGLENWLKLCCTLAHAPSSGAPSIKPIALRRVAPEGELPEELGLRLSGPAIFRFSWPTGIGQNFLPRNVGDQDSGILSTNSEPKQKVYGPLAPLPVVDPLLPRRRAACIPDGVNASPPLH